MRQIANQGQMAGHARTRQLAHRELGRPTLLGVGAAFALLFLAVVGFGPGGFLIFLLLAALAGILATPLLRRNQLLVLLAFLGVLVLALVTRINRQHPSDASAQSARSARAGSALPLD